MTKETAGLISEDDIRQIVELVEALDRSDLDLLQLDVGRLRLTLGKGQLVTEPAAPPARAATSSARAAAPVEVSPAAPVERPKAAAARAPAASSGDGVDVRAPIMGLFYAKPDPSSPPFVSVGANVQEGSTVGLIEVMKVFNAVQAGVDGVVAEICVENGQTVEIGQTLFRIRPHAK